MLALFGTFQWITMLLYLVQWFFFSLFGNHIYETFFFYFFCILGPVANTFGDFWRTVWEQGVCVVIMVTNIVEGGRVIIKPSFHVLLWMKTNCQPVETVGLNSNHTHTLGLGEERKNCYSCNITCSTFKLSQRKTKNHKTCLKFFALWSVEKPTHNLCKEKGKEFLVLGSCPEMVTQCLVWTQTTWVWQCKFLIYQYYLSRVVCLSSF